MLVSLISYVLLTIFESILEACNTQIEMKDEYNWSIENHQHV